MIDLKDLLTPPESEPCSLLPSTMLSCLVDCFRAKKEKFSPHYLVCYVGSSQGAVVCEGDSCAYGFSKGQIDCNCPSTKSNSQTKLPDDFLFREPDYAPTVFRSETSSKKFKKVDIFG